MKVVVDSNILFSALLPTESKIRNTLLTRDNYFYMPHFVFVEIFKYKEKILKCSRLNEIELYEILHKILLNIHFVNESMISKDSIQRAFQFRKNQLRLSIFLNHIRHIRIVE